MPALEFLEQWCLPAIRSNQEVWISFYPYHIFNDLARYKVAFMTQQPHQFKEHFVSFQMYTLMYNRIIYCSNIIYKNIFGFTIIVPGVIVFSSVLKKAVSLYTVTVEVSKQIFPKVLSSSSAKNNCIPKSLTISSTGSDIAVFNAQLQCLYRKFSATVSASSL